MLCIPEDTRGITEQSTFNHHLSQARTTVERAFGCLKRRWRCLLKQWDCHGTLISDIISTSHKEEYQYMGKNERHDGRPDHADCLIGGESGANIRNTLDAHFSTV